jgi:hypothetical protein
LASAWHDRDVRQLAGELGTLARRRPGVFLGAGFAAGVLAARFLKSAPPGVHADPGPSARKGRTRQSRATGTHDE